MKKLTFAAMLTVCVGIAQAVTFSNSTFLANPAAASIEVVTSNSITRVLSNCDLTPNMTMANIAWTYDFAPDQNEVLTGVELTIRGTISGGVGMIYGTEVVRDVTGPATIIGSQMIMGPVSGANWSVTTLIPFPHTNSGNIQKDILFLFEPIAGTAPGVMSIKEIEQKLVPEPASIFAVATGVVGLLALRRRR